MSDSLTFVGNATTVLRLGAFTLLTDPNFLHRGQYAYLGKGVLSRRLREPSCQPADLPALDLVVLSHLHGDHFDRIARRELTRGAPVVTTPKAQRRLRQWGFTAHGLDTWQRHRIDRDGETLSIEALPGVHGHGPLARLMPPVMGSLLEHRVGGEVRRRVYLSGDTVTGPHFDAIRDRHPDIDLAVLHLGGTRVLLHTLTMDAAEGVRALRTLLPEHAVPVHYDDYTVMRSPLSDFRAAVAEAGLAERLLVPGRGETLALPAVKRG